MENKLHKKLNELKDYENENEPEEIEVEENYDNEHEEEEYENNDYISKSKKDEEEEIEMNENVNNLISNHAGSGGNQANYNKPRISHKNKKENLNQVSNQIFNMPSNQIPEEMTHDNEILLNNEIIEEGSEGHDMDLEADENYNNEHEHYNEMEQENEYYDNENMNHQGQGTEEGFNEEVEYYEQEDGQELQDNEFLTPQEIELRSKNMMDNKREDSMKHKSLKAKFNNINNQFKQFEINNNHYNQDVNNFYTVNKKGNVINKYATPGEKMNNYNKFIQNKMSNYNQNINENVHSDENLMENNTENNNRISARNIELELYKDATKRKEKLEKLDYNVSNFT